MSVPPLQYEALPRPKTITFDENAGELTIRIPPPPALYAGRNRITLVLSMLLFALLGLIGTDDIMHRRASWSEAGRLTYIIIMLGLSAALLPQVFRNLRSWTTIVASQQTLQVLRYDRSVWDRAEWPTSEIVDVVATRGPLQWYGRRSHYLCIRLMNESNVVLLHWLPQGVLDNIAAATMHALKDEAGDAQKPAKM